MTEERVLNAISFDPEQFKVTSTGKVWSFITAYEYACTDLHETVGYFDKWYRALTPWLPCLVSISLPQRSTIIAFDLLSRSD